VQKISSKADTGRAQGKWTELFGHGEKLPTLGSGFLGRSKHNRMTAKSVLKKDTAQSKTPRNVRHMSIPINTSQTKTEKYVSDLHLLKYGT